MVILVCEIKSGNTEFRVTVDLGENQSNIWIQRANISVKANFHEDIYLNPYF